MEEKNKYLNKIALLNRQPTLFRHGLNAVNVLPCEDGDNTIRLPPLMLEQYNADHDGDQLNLYLIHDQEALEELEEKAHLKNIYRYDSDSSMITKVRHEALQACYSLSEITTPNYDKSILEINNLNELPEDFDYWNYELDKPIRFDNNDYTYGICLLNKWVGLNSIRINYTITKKESDHISEIIYEEIEGYLFQINELHKKLLFFISSTNHCPSINIEEMIDMLDDDTDRLFQKLPKNNPYVGYHINEGLIDRCIDNLDPQSDLYKLYKAGSRFSKQQLSNICINIGYVADAKNIVIDEPICTNLMKGLDPQTYFRTAPGSRKGIADKSNITPDSGYLERTLTMALSPVELFEEDCGTTHCLEILVFSVKHAKSLVGKYYRDPQKLSYNWKILDFKTAKSFINKKIYIRSPMTCESPHFKICKKCFGSREFPTKHVGVVSGQIVSERITQLVMRSFHSSGSANLSSYDSTKQFIENHLIDIINEEEYIKLKFNSNKFPNSIQNVGGYYDIDPENNIVIFEKINEPVQNIDVVSVLNEMKQILRSDSNVKQHPSEYYYELMEHLLNVGTPYSSFIEILLCNMFLVDKKENLFWRYNYDKTVVRKLGDKNLARNLSPTLGCLYQPNKNTLGMMENMEDVDINTMSIYEKIWYGTFEE